MIEHTCYVTRHPKGRDPKGYEHPAGFDVVCPTCQENIMRNGIELGSALTVAQWHEWQPWETAQA